MTKKTIITTLLALITMVGLGQPKEPFFRTDSAVVIGKIVGLEGEAMPKQVYVAWNNALTNLSKGSMVDIAADGTFTCRMQLQHPILNTMRFPENEQVQYYLEPGETLQMEIHKDADGLWTSDYGARSSAKRVERLLKANLDFTNEYRIMMLADEGDLKRHTAICDSLIHSALDRTNALADAKQFTSYERQLARTMATSMIYAGFLFRHGEIMRSNMMRVFNDSTFNAELCAPEYYAPVKNLPLNDPILFVPYCYSQLVGSLSKTPVCALASSFLYYAQEQQLLRQALNRVMGDEDNLLTQMAMMQNLPNGLTTAKEAYEHRLQAMADTTLTVEERAEWKKAYVPLDTVRHRAIDGFTQPELRKEAERLFAVTFDESFTYPIPEGDGKALLERIIKPYRGKYVLIDFWAMWCGPCKQAIEKSRNLRRSLKDNPDLQLIFIAQEDKPQTNEAYKQYVSENLLGADCYPVSRKELDQLMELLQFGNIPHYITVSPDGQLLRNSLNYFSNNYELFLQRLEEIKTKI